MYYCGKICQKDAWNVHKFECRNLKRIAPRTLPDAARLLARLIHILRKGGDLTKSYYLENCFRMYKDLMSRKALTLGKNIFNSYLSRLSQHKGRPTKDGTFYVVVCSSFRLFGRRQSPKLRRTDGDVRKGKSQTKLNRRWENYIIFGLFKNTFICAWPTIILI